VADQRLRTVPAELERRHPFAGERVGFLTCGVARLADGGLGIYAAAYHAVPDDDYVDDRRAAAMLGPGAFRKMLQTVYHRPASVFHVHRHEHHGTPAPSEIDKSESQKFVPDFWKVCPHHPHGTLILSIDALWGQVWHPVHKNIRQFDRCLVIGDVLHTTKRRADERS
jgi:hypothetical protein